MNQFQRDIADFTTWVQTGKANHERMKAQKRRWYLKHREKILLYSRNYRKQKKQQEQL